MPKEQKDKIIGQKRKFIVVGHKNGGKKKNYRVIDNHFGSARRVVHVQLPISKYG